MKFFCQILVFILITFSGQKLHSQNFDVNLLKPINKNETSSKNWYLRLNSSATFPLCIGIPAGIAIAGFINHKKDLHQDALFIGGAFFVSSAITISVKKIVNRNRPFQTYSFIVKRDNQSGGYSFPSGHTSSAFCTATSVALRYHKWYFVVPSYVFATSVAWARMYQGLHYPSDIFAGAVVGAGSAWLGWKAQKWFNKKKYIVLPNPTF